MPDFDDQKNYNVDYFSGVFQSDADDELDVFRIFCELEGLDERPFYNLGSYGYQLRSMEVAGNTVKGVLAKFRVADLPHAGGPAGEERELELEEQEGLIEKNHFLVKRDMAVVVFQRNGQAARIGKLGEYITQYTGATVVFNPILQPESIRRMLDDRLQPVSLELSYARPRNLELFPADDWGNRFAHLAEAGGGARAHVKLTADRRSTDPEKNTLANGIKAGVASFVEARLASVARMTLTDGYNDYPIDLIADRLVDSISVRMNGRYPVLNSMFSELDNSYHARREEIDEIFGQPDARIP